jgi:hypothetical protein
MKFVRLAVPLAMAVTLSACGGSGGGLGNVFGGNPLGSECATGTSEELVSPAPFQTSSNVNQITIVANGNNNQLYQNYQNWYIFVTDGFGNQIQGSQLSLVSDTGAPHPFSSDFYYQSQFPQTLPAGQTWNVHLTEYNAGCSDVPLQSFSTYS